MQEDYIIPQMIDEVRAGKLSRRELTKRLALLGVSSAGIGAIIAAALRFSPETHAVQPIQQAQKHLELHSQHLAHQTQGNTDGLRNDYAEHAVVEDSMYEKPFVGHEAIMGRKQVGFAAVTNAQIAVTKRIAHGNQVTVEWVATGTHTGDLPGLPATNRAYEMHGVTVVVREHGKIVREALYYDVADFRKQVSQ